MAELVTPVLERGPARADQPLFVHFVNTLHWYEGLPVELLGDAPALAAWLAEVHLDLPGDPSAALPPLLALRDHLRPLTEALVRREPLAPDDLAAFAAALGQPTGRLVLLEPTSEDPLLAFAGRADAAALVAFRVALSLANFLESGDRKRLKLCGNPGCGFAFVDTSINATRRWCYMRYCGNRLKVRAFRGRRRAEHNPATV